MCCKMDPEGGGEGGRVEGRERKRRLKSKYLHVCESNVHISVRGKGMKGGRDAYGGVVLNKCSNNT